MSKLQLLFNDRRFRWEATVVACLYLGYASLMICKQAVVVASPAMVADASLGMDTATFGQLIGWGAFGALLGKLLNGILADRLGGRKAFLLALTLTVGVVITFGLSKILALFAVLSILREYAKSACWPSFAKLIPNWFHEHQYGTVWGILSTSSRFGVLLSSIFLGALLATLHWRQLFFVSAGLTGFMLVVSYFFLKERPQELGLPPPEEPTREGIQAEGGDPDQEREPPAPAKGEKDTPEGGGEEEDAAPHPLDGLSVGETLKAFSRSPRVWLICLSMCCLTVLMEFVNFLPLYLKNSLGLTAAQAGMASASYPLGCVISVLAGGFIYDRLTPRRIFFSLTGLLLAGVVCVAVLWTLPGWGLADGNKVRVSVATILIMGIVVSPAYYLPMSVFSIRFGGAHSGLLIGLIDAFGYGAQMIFSPLGGQVAQDHGWGRFLLLLGGVAVAAMVLMGAFLRGEMRIEEASE